MAKRQNFIVGSTNPNTNTWTSSQLNNGWNKYQVLKSGDLDGVFNAVSDYSNDSSQEIWNAIRILKGSNPTGASTNELGNIISTVLGAKATKATDFITPLTSNNKGATEADLNTLREEIETSSLTFKGYVSTSAPSSSTYGLVKGNIWINASAMPTTFPVAIAGIWNGTSWATTTDTYTVKDFDFFRNINDNEGYYWFGGQWTVMSTDMSTTYFTLNQTSGKWEIKSSVNLPGSPTTTTPAAGNSSTRIATTAFVANNFAKLASPDFTGTPTAPTPTSGSTDNQIATKKYVDEAIAPLPTTTYFPDLFDVKWADHILNDASWLRADTFSWQSSAMYQVAYAHLKEDYDAAASMLDWTVATQDTNLGSHSWAGIAWNGTKFVALGTLGYVSTSVDGINWTPATQNSDLNGWSAYSVAWNGTKFVALGSSSQVSTSTDGINWTPATQVANFGGHNFSALAWNGTKFVALNSDGYISTSTDGTTWTAATQNANLGSNRSWMSVAWDGSKFVALGISGHVSTSTDGTNWTAATRLLDISRTWKSIVWDGIQFVALADSGYISTSIDGTSWSTATKATNLGNCTYSNIAYDGTKFVALNPRGYTSYKVNHIYTETIAGVTITYYLADDGHKICPDTQESNVAAIYTATGVAWYYIIDTTNQRFKLPRVNPEKELLEKTLASIVSNGLQPRFTNGSATGYLRQAMKNLSGYTHYMYADGVSVGEWGSTALTFGDETGLKLDWSQSQSYYKGNKYLYFYVGNFTQTALENTAGLNTELFNGKADVSTVAHVVTEFQKPTSANGYTWYRKYADGWVEQGGEGTGNNTITLPIAMVDNNYTLICALNHQDNGSLSITSYSRTTTNFYCRTTYQNSAYNYQFSWQVSGMAAN